eukprot:9127526-Pyramimonas_sp.AAC.1
MFDNTIGLEASLCHYPCQRYLPDSGCVLHDVKAAFPSLLHEYIHWILELMEIPPRSRWAIKLLYSQCWVSISYCGITSFGFWVTRGIAQCCPLSGSIFALCLDPILRLMISRLPPDHSRLGAFADDIGIACADVYNALSDTPPLWCTAAGAAGLLLKLEGMQIVMPRLPEHAEFLRRLRALGIRGTKFQLMRAGKYLGVWLGLDGWRQSRRARGG